jgi:hypothetical protein
MLKEGLLGRMRYVPYSAYRPTQTTFNRVRQILEMPFCIALVADTIEFGGDDFGRLKTTSSRRDGSHQGSAGQERSVV